MKGTLVLTTDDLEESIRRWNEGSSLEHCCPIFVCFERAGWPIVAVELTTESDDCHSAVFEYKHGGATHCEQSVFLPERLEDIARLSNKAPFSYLPNGKTVRQELEGMLPHTFEFELEW